jgi:CRP-like cAMP-binding protein
LPNPKPQARSTESTLVSGSQYAGPQIKNEILCNVARKNRSLILQRSQFMQLPTHTVLNECKVPIENAYFINGGLASILSVLKNGKSVEVGLTGKEGFVGVPLIAGFKSSPTRVIMQIAGSGFRISTKDLQVLLKDSPSLNAAMQRYSQEVALQASQIAACNRVHEVDQRLARWLLLGTRRASVTVAAGGLQRQGLISYVRGQLKIEDRVRLEGISCECYNALKQQLALWKSESL